MAKLQLLYDSLTTASTPTASSEVAARPAANLANLFAWSRWQAGSSTYQHWVQWDAGATVTADAFAIHRHNLGEGMTATIQVAASGAGPWTSLASASFSLVGGIVGAPAWMTERQSSLQRFTATASQHWRILFSGNDPWTPEIGVIAIGQLVETERSAHVGMMNPHQARRVEILNNLGDAGTYLGRSVIDRGVNGKIELEHLSPAWVEQTWMPFLMHANRLPFFLAWPPIAAGTHGLAVYAWTPGAVDPPEHSHPNFMKATLEWQGRT